MGWEAANDHGFGYFIPEEVNPQAVARGAARSFAEVELQELLLGTARRVVHEVGVALKSGAHRVY